MLPYQLVESEGVAELLVLVEDLLDGQLVVGQDLQGRLVVTVVILLRLEAGVEGLEIPSWVLGFLPIIAYSILYVNVSNFTRLRLAISSSPANLQLFS